MSLGSSNWCDSEFAEFWGEVMSNNILSVYVNCSKGGMATVFFNRAKNNPNENHDLIFVNDGGAVEILESLANVVVRVCPKNRIEGYIKHLTSIKKYKEVRITSLGFLVSFISKKNNPKIIYEFHTPFRHQMEKEVSAYSFDGVDEIWVPSKNSAGILKDILNSSLQRKLVVVPNPIDLDAFQRPDSPALFSFHGYKPVVWIGRFDNQKNFPDFVRIIKMLPENYHGIAVVSLNSDGADFAMALGEVSAYGISDRVSLVRNLSKEQMRDLYFSIKDNDGFHLSTSIDESFGYTVLESISIGVRTVAFGVGALLEHKSPYLKLIPVGDNLAAVEEILEFERKEV